MSATTCEVHLPEIPAAGNVILTQQLSERTEYPVAGKRGLRTLLNASGSKLNVRQYEMTWLYDLSEDAKVSGYELLIEGDNGKTDCRQKLDLRRNALGQFPGLKEYMSEQGKVLYSVAYDLEGGNEAYGTASPSNWATPADWTTPSDTQTKDIAKGQTATPSNLQPGTVLLECRLKAEVVSEGDEAEQIRFTLTLPDVSAGYWHGSYSSQYQQVYEDGMYRTMRMQVNPVMVNRYYQAPEKEWVYLEKSLMESVSGEDREIDSGDGELTNNLK